MLTQVCNEIAIMKKFNQRNITRLIEVVDDPAEDRMYLVMEFVDGGVLMMALEYMHFHNVCHRDIKPENMLLTGDGVLKVTDFGVSVACEGDDDTQKKTAGTPAFLAPEACHGGAYRGKPADVWAAGVSLYYLATGRLPFEGASMVELYERRRATVAEIREHAWMTDSGASPLPAAETEAAAFEATEEERAGAITVLDRMFTISLLKGKAKALRARATGRVRQKRVVALHSAMGNVLVMAKLREKASQIAQRRSSALGEDGGEGGAGADAERAAEAAAAAAASAASAAAKKQGLLLISRLSSKAEEMAARVRARRALRAEREAARAAADRAASIARLQGRARALAARARAAVAERKAAEALAEAAAAPSTLERASAVVASPCPQDREIASLEKPPPEAAAADTRPAPEAAERPRLAPRSGSRRGLWAQLATVAQEEAPEEAPARTRALPRSASRKAAAAAAETAEAAEAARPPPAEGALRAEELPEDGEEPQRVNQYLLGRVLGKGSYGTVRIARCAEAPRPVAVKVFTKSLLARLKRAGPRPPPPSARRRLTGARGAGSGRGRARGAGRGGPTMLTQVCNEIAIMKKFNQRNITRLIEVVDDPAEDRMYLVMEFVDGGVVKFEEARGPEERAAYARSVFRQLMMALEYMHFHNVCHRDIKPENMLLTGDGVLKVTDFGVSVACEGEDDTQKKTAGTPAFLAPEACHGGAYRGKPADVWAAGVSLYYLATGRLPFEGASMVELYERVGEGRVEYPEGMEPRLRALLERVLERDPERRATVAEIREHAWMTDSGASPLPAAETEAAAFEATEEERAGAITVLDRMFTISLLKGKARALRARATGRVRQKRVVALHSAMGNVLVMAKLREKASQIAQRRSSALGEDGGEGGAGADAERAAEAAAAAAAASAAAAAKKQGLLLISRLSSKAEEMAARVRARRALRAEREAARAAADRAASIARLQGRARALAARARAAVAERKAAEALAARLEAASGAALPSVSDRVALIARLRGKAKALARRAREAAAAAAAAAPEPEAEEQAGGQGAGSAGAAGRRGGGEETGRTPERAEAASASWRSLASPTSPASSRPAPALPRRRRAGSAPAPTGPTRRPRAPGRAAGDAGRGRRGGGGAPLELPPWAARWLEAVFRVIACCGTDAAAAAAATAAVPMPPTPRSSTPASGGASYHSASASERGAGAGEGERPGGSQPSSASNLLTLQTP
eukprot:tig00000802_g4261.t1